MTTTTLMTDGATTTDAAASQTASTADTPQQTTATGADTSTQPPQQATPADTGDAAKDEAPKGAPEKYEAFKLADGALSAAELARVEADARELGLSQETAQKLAEKRVADKADSAKAMADGLTAKRADWVTEVKNDKDLGGEKLTENLAVAVKGLKALDPDGVFQKLLDETGFGDHPEVIRLFHRAGKAMSEDGFVKGTRAPSGATKSLAQRMYPNMNP